MTEPMLRNLDGTYSTLAEEDAAWKAIRGKPKSKSHKHWWSRNATVGDWLLLFVVVNVGNVAIAWWLS